MSGADQIYSVLSLKIFAYKQVAVPEYSEDGIDPVIHKGLSDCVVS
jgi:hypothetical protein